MVIAIAEKTQEKKSRAKQNGKNVWNPVQKGKKERTISHIILRPASGQPQKGGGYLTTGVGQTARLQREIQFPE